MINLQVESRHKEFFGVLCLHDYYHDKVCRDLEFEPTLETAMLMRNYKLVFKPADFGFVVLYTPGYSEERLKEIPPKTRFSFKVKNRNARFMNFSQLPFWPEGVTFHYSNLYDATENMKMDFTGDVYYYFKELNVVDVKKKLLHLPDHVLMGKVAALHNVGLGADDPKQKGVSYDSIVIKDEFGTEFLTEGIPYKKRFRDVQKGMLKRFVDHHTRDLAKENLSPSEKEKRFIEIFNQQEQELTSSAMSDHVIDLRHVPSGKYSVKLGDNPATTVYATESPESKTFGMLDIHVDAPKDALLNRNAESMDQVVNSQLFHIHYEARATYWRYIFVNVENSKITARQVRDENNMISFSEPVDGRLPQVGNVVQYCVSETPIPLQDRPKQIFFLARMNGKRPMKEIRLPTPAATMVKPERMPGENEEKVYSEVYVYL